MASPRPRQLRLPHRSAPAADGRVVRPPMGSAGRDPQLTMDPLTQGVKVTPGDGDGSVAFDVVQAAVDAVARGKVTIAGQTGPTVAARFYAITGTTLYEAWQLFDPARSSLEGAAGRLQKLERWVGRLTRGLSEQRKHAFLENVMATVSLAVLTAQAPEAAALFAGVCLENVSRLGGRLDAAAALVAATLAREILRHYDGDGATAGATAPYTPVNRDPAHVVVIDRWTPGYLVDDDPGSGLQSCLGPGWGGVRAFLESAQLDAFLGSLKPPEPFLLQAGATADLATRTITTADGSVVPIAPEAVGALINPAFIAQAERVITVSAGLSEKEKFIAEFWEDGAGTPFPPGTWMIFGQYAAEKQDLPLGEEVKLYFTLGHALQSAAVATWREKIAADYARPVEVIRSLSALGLLGAPDPITGISTFEAYSRTSHKIERINGTDWETYQRPGGSYSPPFPEFPSGHSTFSAAAATVLERFVGPAFGAQVSGTPVFEPAGLNGVVTLEWDTWQQAAEEAGLSRLFGGIHFDDGNIEGQRLGTLIGQATVLQASQLWA